MSATPKNAFRAIAESRPVTRTASDRFALRVNQELRLSTRGDQRQRLNTDEFTLNKLNLKDLGIIGREEEKRILKMCFHELLHGSPRQEDTLRSKLVTISGFSGSGKTLLAHELRHDVIKQQGFFCVGKFDLQNRVEPYTAFTQALSQLVDQIKEKGDRFKAELTSTIQETVGTDAHVLSEVVPRLAELFDSSLVTTESVTAASVEKRAVSLHVLFRKFVRAVCSNWNPLVVVLDDLQWADSASLDLVEALLTDEENPFFMFVGTLRRNEIDEEHIVLEKMKALDTKGVIEHRIVVENLSVDAVRSIVSTALRTSEELVRSLAVIVHDKTHGNPFFVVQFLQSLVEKDLLTFNFGTLKWTWLEGRIQELFVTDNVADLLTSKLQGLSDELQQLLQVSACLGQRFNEETLTIAYDEVSKSDVLPMVVRASSVNSMCEVAVREGIFQHGGSTYVFAHDQIQEAAFSLIAEGSRFLLKLRIGEGLLSCGARRDVDQRLFLAVDLCNSASLLLDDNERLGLAKYNLMAGEKAMKKSAFIPAKQYFESGIGCLGADAFTDSYCEWLKLMTGIVEATYCCGDIDAMERYVEIVMNAPCPFEDKIRVFSTRILMLAAQKRYQESISAGLLVLGKMGMARFSERPSALVVLKELMYTRFFMRKYDLETLINLPELADKKRIMAMGIIDMMTAATHLSRPNLFVVSFLKSLRWSVRYGVCKFSPNAFAIFGLLLNGVWGPKEGVVYGEVALALSDRLKARETMAKTTLSVYGFLWHFSHDLRACIKPLLYCYQVGMETGDVEVAIFGSMIHDWTVFCAATRPLERLLSDVGSHISRAREYKQESAEAFGLQLQQLLLNLLGRCVDPLVLTGSAMNQEAMYRMAREEKSQTIKMEVDCCRLLLAFLHGQYQKAAELSKLTADQSTTGSRNTMLVPRVHMYRAMTWLALARDGVDRNANLRRAAGTIKKLKVWYKDGNVNVLHMRKLLCAAEAEASCHPCRPHRTAKHKEVVTTLYREAIHCASRGGFLQDKALCHEWVGRFYLEQEGDCYWASYHLSNAARCYKEWGATALVSRLMQSYGTLFAKQGCDLGDCILDQSRPAHRRFHFRNSI